ncbi:MAG TPA: DUF192 domain-containing protein [Chloroflexota bacterium]|nr:DUF192 domain-containing protein [Chloroflexota bacterium]
MPRALALLPLLPALLLACATGAPAAQPTQGPPACDSGYQPPASLASASTLAPTFKHGTVTIDAASGPLVLRVDVAQTEVQHEFGLMYRNSMPPDCGMVFVFQPPADAKQIAFWMKDTLIPLSIAFVLPNDSIESLQEMAAMDDQTLHYAPQDYEFAIEANKGYFTSHGVAVGDKIEFAVPS